MFILRLHSDSRYMDLLNTNCCLRLKSRNLQMLSPSRFLARDIHICRNFSTKLYSRHGGTTKALASQNHIKKLRKRQKMQKEKQDLPLREGILDENEGVEEDKMSYSETNEVQPSVLVPSRSAVLQACTFTSLSIGALGLLIRQVSHVVSGEGWPVLDCSQDITFSFESWHFGLIIGSLILVSSCRLLLLKIWPDFAESSKAANQQVLTSLEPLDYMVIAFLPGISEELLFRGALMPLFGVSWMSIFGVAALFGVLHLGSGRKYSFAVWATFVGVVYGYGTSLSSSIVVPMASHALNNLVGGISWRLSSDAPEAD